MAELATIARPYAQALFSAGGSAAGLDTIAGWLETLSSIAADPQLCALVDHPKTTESQIFDVMASIPKQPLPEMARNFLRLVIENKRLSTLPEIFSQFCVLRNTHAGASDALILSAFPIEDAALADLVKSLEKRFGCVLNVKVKLDRTLIGGIRVIVGDEVLDTSVKARLEQMKAVLCA